MDTKDDEDFILSKIVQDSMDLEVVQDSIDAEDEDFIDVTSKQKLVFDIDLNLPTNCGFDWNKFPNDDDESSNEKGLKTEVRAMMKIYLPKFY
ncbi:hypothetical protein HKD37_12G033264 [Glycine soja]|uniref:Uncharacterized protein n=1 Tax=Glycine soja TaxID=3848 RepID=A0A445HLD9_GLYSO|nr:hypothetical protein D0Y65_033466 [Glycine soja]